MKKPSIRGARITEQAARNQHIEKLAKERLKALKTDYEEVYMKLIDTACHTRTTHLLRRTDAFLDSLAQAVIEQQKEGGGDGDLELRYDPDDPATEDVRCSED